MVSRSGARGSADRAGGRTAVAMAVCGYAGGGIAGRIARDPARPGRLQGHAGQDRSQRRARHCPADAARLVPTGALQVAAGARSASAADGAQAAADQKPRRRDEPARRAARLWTEGRPDNAAHLREPDPGIGCRPCHAVDGGRGAAGGPRHAFRAMAAAWRSACAPWPGRIAACGC